VRKEKDAQTIVQTIEVDKRPPEGPQGANTAPSAGFQRSRWCLDTSVS